MLSVAKERERRNSLHSFFDVPIHNLQRYGIPGRECQFLYDAGIHTMGNMPHDVISLMQIKHVGPKTAEAMVRAKRMLHQEYEYGRDIELVSEFDQETMITVRLPRAIHCRLREEAAEHGTSMNIWCICKLVFNMPLAHVLKGVDDAELEERTMGSGGQTVREDGREPAGHSQDVRGLVGPGDASSPVCVRGV